MSVGDVVGGVLVAVGRKLEGAPEETPLTPEQLAAVKRHLGAASTQLKHAREKLDDAQAVYSKATRPKAEAAFARDIKLIADVTLDLRQQVEALELRVSDGQ